MELGFNLTIQLSQRLALTPELKQSIALLQFNMEQFLEYIETQLMENPVLEEAGYEDQVEFEGQQVRAYSEKVIDASPDNRRDPAVYLMFQLGMCVLSKNVKSAATYIILSLDERGYFTEDCSDIARALGIRTIEAENALSVVQSFDPPGVGARSAGECLKLQMKAKGIDTWLSDRMLDEDLEAIAYSKVYELAKKYNVKAKQVQKIIDQVRELDPNPFGILTDLPRPEYINPDVFVREESGEYIITLNEKLVPKLYLDPYYQEIYSAGEQPDEVKDYLKERIEHASWLVRAVSKRNQTICRISEMILERQREFFEIGEKGLKPMAFADVAVELGIHETTVGRTVNGKYMQTPRGTYELRYFFPSGVDAETSSVSIKSHICEIIDEEDEKNPYSDECIAAELSKRGIDVARRTIAKYRAELGIPSSAKRRKR